MAAWPAQFAQAMLLQEGKKKMEAAVRCPWAITFGTLSTRCHLTEGHAGLQWRHEGSGLREFPAQVISWNPGEKGEYKSDRDDEHAWGEHQETDQEIT